MIVVFGSLNMDLIFHVDRMPQPGDVILTKSYATLAGGKGANQAYAAAKSGGKVKMYGAVGDDGFGKVLKDGLKKAGADVSGVMAVKNVPTGTAPIFVDKNAENHIIVAQCANGHAKAAQVPDKELTPKTYVLLQQEVDLGEINKLIYRAYKKKAKVILNLAPAQDISESTLKKLSVFVVNEAEAAAVAKKYKLDQKNPESMAKALSKKYKFATVLTLGAKGVVAAIDDKVWHVPSLKIKPVDTTGAGDAFVGALAASLDRGDRWTDALRWASVAGALTCLKTGAQTAVPSSADIRRHLSKLGSVKTY